MYIHPFSHSHPHSFYLPIFSSVVKKKLILGRNNIGRHFPSLLHPPPPNEVSSYTYVSGGQYAQNLLSLGEGKLQVTPHKISERTFGVEK